MEQIKHLVADIKAMEPKRVQAESSGTRHERRRENARRAKAIAQGKAKKATTG